MFFILFCFCLIDICKYTNFVHINNTFKQNNNKYFHLFLRSQCLQGFQDGKKYYLKCTILHFSTKKKEAINLLNQSKPKQNKNFNSANILKNMC